MKIIQEDNIFPSFVFLCLYLSAILTFKVINVKANFTSTCRTPFCFPELIYMFTYWLFFIYREIYIIYWSDMYYKLFPLQITAKIENLWLPWICFVVFFWHLWLMTVFVSAAAAAMARAGRCPGWSPFSNCHSQHYDELCSQYWKNKQAMIYF